MRISVIGCGYLGTVHAAAMASIGHDVVGIDVDPCRIGDLAEGRAPFFESGLPRLLEEETRSGRLAFTTDFSAAAGSDVHFICVGTPQRAGDDAADLTFVNAAVDALVPHLSPGDVVAGKSTVPVGTVSALRERIDATGAVLVWNPEFLREGRAVEDTVAPDRLVVGIPGGDEGERAADVLRDVYARAIAAGSPFLVTDCATAELVKIAANAFLATKISFINAMAEIAEVAGADVSELADAIGCDPRIGRSFLSAGIGFGGGCLPKDIRAFAARAEELGTGQSTRFLREVDAINARRRDHAADLLAEAFDGDLLGRRVTVLGAAFKPNSDDVRDSPALDIAARLRSLGATVTVTDPEAIENARRMHPELRYEPDLDAALLGADAVLLATEWDEYRRLEPERAGESASGRVIVDGRNCLDSSAWHAAGWDCIRMGRPRLRRPAADRVRTLVGAGAR